MRYSYSNDIKLVVKPQEINKDSGKEVLQYAVGGLLYTPASNEKIIAKILDGTFWYVKSLVMDLEDSLGDDLVGFGQRTIQSNIQLLDEAIKNEQFKYEDLPLIFIRVRNPEQIRQSYDMLKTNMRYITGFNIPKFDKHSCDGYIEVFKEVKDKVERDTAKNSTLYMMPIIENKLAMYRQLRMDNLLYINDALRPISDNVLNIRVGGADFCSIFGIRRNVEHHIHEIGVIRSVLSDIINVFGKNYVVSGPVWEFFENKDDPFDTKWKDGLKREIEYDRLNGFIGKTCIHPSQLPIIQQSLIIDNSEYQDAINILGMNVNTVGVKKSANGNRMNEAKTHTNWARKIMSLAYIYGVREDG